MFLLSKDIREILAYFLMLFPILLISGPFLSDLLTVIFSIFFVVKFKNFSFNEKSKFFLLSLLIFYFLINLSSFLSDQILISLKSSVFYFRFIFFSFVISILISFVEKKNIRLYFDRIFLFIILFLFLDAFYQYFNGYNLFGFRIDSHLSNQRVSSLFVNELNLGSFLSKVMFIYVGIIHIQKINEDNILNIDYKILFILLISLLTIFISGERAAFVLAMLGTIIYLTVNFNFRVIVIILSIISIVFMTFLEKPNFKNRYTELFETIFIQKNIGQSTHHQHFRTSLKMYQEKKFFGHGIKSFREKCKLKKYNSGPRSCSTHPHNYYLQLLSATGIFTFLILLSFFIFVSFELLKNFYNKINKIRINNKKNCYLISAFISIFPLTTTGSFFNNWISVTLFLSLGFLISEYKLIKYLKN